MTRAVQRRTAISARPGVGLPHNRGIPRPRVDCVMSDFAARGQSRDRESRGRLMSGGSGAESREPWRTLQPPSPFGSIPAGRRAESRERLSPGGHRMHAVFGWTPLCRPHESSLSSSFGWRFIRFCSRTVARWLCTLACSAAGSCWFLRKHATCPILLRAASCQALVRGRPSHGAGRKEERERREQGRQPPPASRGGVVALQNQEIAWDTTAASSNARAPLLCVHESLLGPGRVGLACARAARPPPRG
eukprot:5974353-Prymnesium_polylepis.1